MRRIFALDFVRAAAIVCVLLAHAWYARMPEGTVDGSLAAHGMLVSLLLFQAGTAVFVLISGALVIPKERREGFPFLWRRAFSFLLLAAFWSVVTNACWYVANGWDVSSSLLHSLRYHSLLFGGWGNRAGYLWFLLMMWGLYLAAPYSPRALAKVRTVPEAMPGAAAGTVIFQKIRPSLMPRVRPALIRSTLTCSKAARAFRYIRGKEITEAATIQPSQVCTSLMLKVPYSQLPSGLRREKSSSRKKNGAEKKSTSDEPKRCTGA